MSNIHPVPTAAGGRTAPFLWRGIWQYLSRSLEFQMTSPSPYSISRKVSIVSVPACWWRCYWLGMPEALDQAHSTPSKPPDVSSTRDRDVAGPDLLFLTKIAGGTSAKTLRELRGTWFITHRLWRVQSTHDGHTVRSWRERKRERARDFAYMRQ